MMPLQEQVCDFEYSKKFKELGFNKKSYYYWVNKWPNTYPYPVLQGGFIEKLEGNQFPAYTVAELGNYLPHRITIKRFKDILVKDSFTEQSFNLVSRKFNKNYLGWCINYVDEYQTDSVVIIDKLIKTDIFDKKEANIRAMVLLWVIENKIMSI